MAILLEKERKEWGLIFLVLILVISLFLINKKLIMKVKPEEIIAPKLFRKIEIDYKLLEDKLLEILSPLEPITPEREIGRENPFVPY